MFMHSYCYICSVLGILFHCVALCIVCVDVYLLLPPSVNPIAVNKYCISDISIVNIRKQKSLINEYMIFAIQTVASIQGQTRNKKMDGHLSTIYV